MAKNAFHVIIIGGGLGGLCSAQGLKKAGISVAVYERDRTPSERLQGYRISINAQGSRALYNCLPPQLYDTFLATCGKPGRGLRTITEQLQELAFFSVPETNAEPDPIESPKSVSRMTLRQILLAGLDDIVHFDKTFTHYEETPDGKVTAFFEDNTSACGDLLVAADGGNSRVRNQLLPSAKRIETGVDAIMGKVLLTEETRSLLLPGRLDGSTVVLAPRGCGMFVSLYEFHQNVEARPGGIGGNDGSFQHEAGLLFDNTRDYLFWGLVARREKFGLSKNPQSLNGEALQQVTESIVQHWHPRLQQLVRMADPTTVIYTPLRTSLPIKPWPTTHITLIGDAIHSMTPAQGIGGNTALRDASLLCQQLAAFQEGEKQLLLAIHDYEAEMVKYGFDAVRASRRSLDMIVVENLIARFTVKAMFRLMGMIFSRKRSRVEKGGERSHKMREDIRL
jgi:salicylate hydroxylase